MRLPLPVRALTPDPARLRPVGLRAALHRLWAHLREGQTPEACLTRARARAALRAEYQGLLDLYPDPRGRRAPLAARPVQPGEDRP